MDKWHVGEECDFAELVTGPLDENPCSPVIDDPDFQGLVIHGPEVVVYDPGETIGGGAEFADVRICGTACFDYSFRGLGGEVQNEILLVAVDAATHETFSGKLPGIENAEPPPDDLPAANGPTDGLIVETYFNPNLVEALGLPERPAEYVVYAMLGDVKSNTVRIRVQERD